MFNFKAVLAEFIGTFALVFVAIAVALVNGNNMVPVALAEGFVVAVFIYVYGNISGAHINPAVTFGLALNGSIKWATAAFYWIAQFLGAILAGLLFNYLVGALSTILGQAITIDGGLTVGILNSAGPGKVLTPDSLLAMAFEALLTFFLVNTYLHTMVAGKVGPSTGWAVGMTLAFAILAGGPFTGASLNPAHTFGVALFSKGVAASATAAASAAKQSITDPFLYVVYFVGPLLGATLAVLAYNYFVGITDEDLDVDDDDEMEFVEPVEEVVVVKKAARKPAARKTGRK